MSRYAQDLQGNLILIAGNADYDVIAPKETSPATAPHTTGSRIFYGNALYEVTADIAVNDALVVGTNITASDDITDLIEDKVDKTDLTSIIATGTTNTTGSPIAAGKYFYLNGVMVRAKADITNNEAFALNTNYEEVPTGALNDLIIKDTGWITLNATYGVTYRKKAGIVFVRCRYDSTVSQPIVVPETLPVAYRPSVPIFVSNYNQGNFTDANFLSIGTGGSVTLNGTGGKWFNCITSYPEN